MEGDVSMPRYCIRLKGIDISENEISCTGKQFLTILEILSKNLNGCVWYGADIEVIPFNSNWGLYRDRLPKLIGKLDQLINYSQNVEQFYSGVFLCVCADKDIYEWGGEFDTEDESYRGIGAAAVEIRAFDTTYFEIYSSDLSLITEVSNHFSCDIESAPVD
jgi:hypothetical protein